MSVPASKVKSVCTSSEIALVRASRKPNLEEHSPAELKELAGRARKLFDKWRDLGRGQSRTRSRQVGSGVDDTNTELKTEIFRDALQSFEAQMAKGAASGPSSDKKSKPKQPKRARSAEHRAGRAEIRKELNQTRLKKSTPRKAAKVAKRPPAESSSVEGAPAKIVSPAALAAPSKVAPKTAGKKQKVGPPAATAGLVSIIQSKQRRAITAAKKSRVVRSGLTTRVRGHVSARGRRKQARRDAMN